MKLNELEQQKELESGSYMYDTSLHGYAGKVYRGYSGEFGESVSVFKYPDNSQYRIYFKQAEADDDFVHYAQDIENFETFWNNLKQEHIKAGHYPQNGEKLLTRTEYLQFLTEVNETAQQQGE